MKGSYKKLRQLTQDSPLFGFLIFVSITLFLTVLFIWLTSSSELVNSFGYKDVVDFATAAGAVAALVIGIISSYLVFVSFQAQIKFNEEQRQLISEQRRDFEEEKLLTAARRDSEAINLEIGYLIKDISFFKYGQLEGSEAIYQRFMKPIRVVRHLNYVSDYVHEETCKYLKKLSIEGFKDLLNHYGTLPPNTFLSDWDSVKNKILQTKSYKKLGLLNNSEIKLQDIVDICSISYVPGYEDELFVSISNDLYKLLDNKITASLARMDFGETVNPVLFLNYAFTFPEYKRLDIDPSEFFFDGEEEKAQMVLAETPIFTHFERTKLTSYISHANWIISLIKKSALSFNEKISLQQSFERMLFSNLSREFLFLEQGYSNSNEDSIFAFFHFEQFNDLRNELLSNFDTYNRFVESKVYSASEFSSDSFLLPRSGSYLHNPFSIGGKYGTIDDDDLICGYWQAIDVFMNSLIFFLEKISNPNEYRKISEILFNSLDKANLSFERNSKVTDILFDIMNMKYCDKLRGRHISELMLCFSSCLADVEKKFNKPFNEIEEIPILGLKLGEKYKRLDL